MKTFTTIVCLLIPFPRPRRRLRTWLKNKFPPRPQASALDALRRYAHGRDVILWFDHSLGGGTETYSMNRFADLKRSGHAVIRIQYFPWCKMFGLSAPNKPRLARYMVASLSDVYDAVWGMKISRIVVNNLVGYPGSTDVLETVSELKRQSGAFVSFRGHDFQAICPSFNLMNCDGNFCNFKYRRGCEYCWRHKFLGNNEYENNILRSGATTIADWRAQWGRFFADTCDEIIVFSNRIAEMFVHIYPQLANKISVIPHVVPPLRRVTIAPHTGINIACLGNMLPVKGRDIILQMSEIIRDNENIHITVIGTMDDIDAMQQNLTVTGKYNPQDLPSIIEKHKIDLIFIPSIWPETFSYTTAEAMSMGVPVACYDMGAPAERVSQYSHGMVLAKINPKHNLKELIDFIKHLNKEQ